MEATKRNDLMSGFTKINRVEAPTEKKWSIAETINL